MASVEELAPALGTVAACKALGVSRDAPWRQRRRAERAAFVGPPVPRHPRKRPHLALDESEIALILETLNSERFVDTAPATVHATLLDEGVYLGSVRTMYRVLEEIGATSERRRQRTHPSYVKPELLATGPNQVYSWDITKLKGPAKWTCFHLYVILDIYSRYVVGWMIADRESADLAKQLIDQTIKRQNIEPGTLTLHADRGASMRSKPVADLLIDLGVAKSHSRPYVSDDNPYSESQFKTLKSRPTFPARFGCIEDARAHCQAFFSWYNHEHRHSGIGFMTPHAVHFGEHIALNVVRQNTLDAAYTANPARFKSRRPKPPRLPTAAWINPPKPTEPGQPTTTMECAVN